MKKYKLSFCEITLLQDDIAEVITNEGVEINLEMVGEYHEFLLNHMKHPFSVLINRLNSYSYTFEAQQHIATLEQLNGIAVVSYRKATESTTKSLIAVNNGKSLGIKIFKDRHVALKWLEVKQAIV